MHSLYIIDSHAQIYRSYFAVMGLKSPSGEPTNATFGFVAMLLKLYQMRKPSHVVLAMDAGTSGREMLAASYKVQRKPMPEDMAPQIDRILQIVDTLGMPLYRAEGYEADDAMATLVKQVCADESIVSGGGCRMFMCTKENPSPPGPYPHPQRLTRYLVKRLEALGHQVTVQPVNQAA